MLTAEQITAGALLLTDNKLTESQVDDIVSIWRIYLGNLASGYSLRSTLEAQTDTVTSKKCAKLAACLTLWQDVQFDVSGFAATNASRNGYFDSTERERKEIFLYSFGLFWEIPQSLLASLNQGWTASSQGFANRVSP